LNPGLEAVPGIRVGHAQDRDARTGCTVVLGPFRAACDARGSAIGSRELAALAADHLVPRADAILLTGGSAFGLAAADGVAAWLEERRRGFDTGVAIVPIVPAAVIFDLAAGRPDRRPDAAMGRAACDAADTADSAEGGAGRGITEGLVGAGTGATVSKLAGPGRAVPGGLGTWALHAAGYTVAALVVVNALGDVVDGRGGIVAGALDDDGQPIDTLRLLRDGAAGPGWHGSMPPAGTNTTLAVVASDAPLSRTALWSLARMAATGMVRRIAPVNTPFDGDITFALSPTHTAGEVEPELLLALGAAAAEAVETAIDRAVTVRD
jgi:L-aminopeptidase/D-esterase-like protein